MPELEPRLFSFISLGLPDALLGVAWPAIRVDLSQPLAAVGLPTITGTVSAVISSMLTARVVQRIGTARVVASSGLLSALALVGIAFAPSFSWLLLWMVPLGLGAGLVDASLNHFVATHYAARHMSWNGGAMAIGLIQQGLAAPSCHTNGAYAGVSAQRRLL